MSWVAAAVAGSAVVGGALNADAAGKASDAQSQASSSAINEQRRQYDQTRQDTASYRQAGGQAMDRIGSLLGLGSQPTSMKSIADQIRGTDQYRHLAGLSDDELIKQFTDHAPVYLNTQKDLAGTSMSGGQLDTIRNIQGQLQASNGQQSANPEFGSLNKKFSVGDFWEDPVTKLGYQSGLDLGTKAINNMAGASGMRRSGQTLKGLTKFGEDYAGSKAADSESRFYGDQDRTLNRLLGTSGSGQAATNTVAGAGQNTASNIGNIMTAEGNARGAAGIAKANSFATGLNTVGNWWNQQNTLDKILGAGGGGTPLSNYSYTGNGVGGYQYG